MRGLRAFAALKRAGWAGLKPRLGPAIVAMTLIVTAWSLYDARQDVRRVAEQHQDNVALALVRHIERAVTTTDLSVQAAMRSFGFPGLSTLAPKLRQELLFDQSAAAEGMGGIYIADEQGRMLYNSGSQSASAVNIVDRDYFRFHRDHPSGGLQISGPLRSRFNGRWTIILSRRLEHPDGSFAGIGFGGIQVDFFRSVLDNLDLGPGGSVTVFTTGGTLIARYPEVPGDTGRDMHGGGLHEHIAAAPQGDYEATSRSDGVSKLFTYRQVGDLPLAVAVSFSTREMYAAWLRRTVTIGALMLLLGTLDTMLGLALGRELRQRLRAEQAAEFARADAERSARDLAQSLAQRDTLINNTADSMVLARLGPRGDFTYLAVNPVWERLTGVPAPLALGRSPHACLPAALADTAVANWNEALRSRLPIRFAFSLNDRETGKLTHWDALTCPIIEADGRIELVIGVARDVTSQRNLEDKLRYAHRMDAIGELSAGIAHDFNSLLQAIQGSLEIAGEQAGMDDDGRSAIRTATEATGRAARLVHQMLAFSRKQVLAPVVLGPQQVREILLPLLRPLLGSTYQVATRITPDAGSVLADRDQLARCMVDLVLNARDAMAGQGDLLLRIDHAASPQAVAAGLLPGDYVRFAVEDDGAGMSPETVARAFEPFFTTRPVGKGTGLGLPMVQGFARQSGGDVTIESALGRGTVVTLWLPRIADDAPVAQPTKSAPHSGIGPPHRRVLLVDDEQSVRDTLSMFLRKAGYQPVLAETGEQALDRLRADGPFDLLITDQSMPGISGTELLEIAARSHPDLPGMLITGYDRVTGIERLGRAVPVLTKPFGRAHFLSQVDALMAVGV